MTDAELMGKGLAYWRRSEKYQQSTLNALRDEKLQNINDLDPKEKTRFQNFIDKQQRKETLNQFLNDHNITNDNEH